MDEQRIITVTDTRDQHVECIDMYKLLAMDNIRFRLGVLRNTLFTITDDGYKFYIDDEIIMKYFRRAIQEADKNNLALEKAILVDNRFSYMRHFICRIQDEGHYTSDFSYLEEKIAKGLPMLIVSTGNKNLTKKQIANKFRMLKNVVAKLVNIHFPDWHYAIIGDDKHANTLAIWSDNKGEKEKLKSTVIAEAFILNITNTIFIEDGEADLTLFEQGHYKTFELGRYKRNVYKMYLEFLEGKTDKTIDDLPVTEKWVIPMSLVFKNREDYRMKFRKILEYNGFNTNESDMNPDDIRNLDWYKLLPLAIDTTREILPN